MHLGKRYPQRLKSLFPSSPKFEPEHDFQIGKTFQKFGIKLHCKELDLCTILFPVFRIENVGGIGYTLQRDFNLPTASSKIQEEVPLLRENRQDLIHCLV